MGLTAAAAFEAIPSSIVTGLEGAAVGAGLGAAGSAITGGDPSKGALYGGLSGGAAGAIGDALGLGSSSSASSPAADTTTQAVGQPGTLPTPAALTASSVAPTTQSAAAFGAPPDLSGGGGGGDIAAADTGPNMAQRALQSLFGGGTGETVPLPPVPPTLDAAGQSTGSYPSLELAKAAYIADQANAAGGVAATNAGGQGLDGSYTYGQGADAAKPSGLLGDIGSAVRSNPGLLLSALGLGVNAARGNQPIAGQTQLSQEANALLAQGTANSNALTTGTLPAGSQAIVNQAAQASKARIRSQYAQMGLSGSTMEAQAMSQVDQQTSAQAFQILQSLSAQGLSEQQLAIQLQEKLLGVNASQQNALSQSIGNIAGALGGAASKGG